MARSAFRRAVIRAQDRIENAMTDVEAEGGKAAADTVMVWYEAEYLTSHPDQSPGANGGAVPFPQSHLEHEAAQASRGGAKVDA